MARKSNRLKRLEEAHADIIAFKAGKPNTVKVYTVTVPDQVDVKKVRTKMRLTQVEFSDRYGFDPSALRDWEQGRRKPDRAARILIKVIEKEPEAVARALAEA